MPRRSSPHGFPIHARSRFRAPSWGYGGAEGRTRAPESFAHLFERDLPRAGPGGRAARPARGGGAALVRQLAATLATSGENVQLELKKIGPELAFHLAVDPELHEAFAKGLRRGGGRAMAAPSMAAIRGDLARLASPALRRIMTGRP